MIFHKRTDFKIILRKIHIFNQASEVLVSFCHSLLLDSSHELSCIRHNYCIFTKT